MIVNRQFVFIRKLYAQEGGIGTGDSCGWPVRLNGFQGLQFILPCLSNFLIVAYAKPVTVHFPTLLPFHHGTPVQSYSSQVRAFCPFSPSRLEYSLFVYSLLATHFVQLIPGASGDLLFWKPMKKSPGITYIISKRESVEDTCFEVVFFAIAGTADRADGGVLYLLHSAQDFRDYITRRKTERCTLSYKEDHSGQHVETQSKALNRLAAQISLELNISLCRLRKTLTYSPPLFQFTEPSPFLFSPPFMMSIIQIYL